jgi:hypothetical protein
MTEFDGSFLFATQRNTTQQHRSDTSIDIDQNVTEGAPCKITVKGSSESGVAEGVRLIRGVIDDLAATLNNSAAYAENCDSGFVYALLFIMYIPFFFVSCLSPYRIVGSGSGSVPTREGMGRGRMHTLPSWMASDTNSASLGKDPTTTEAPAASEDKDALIARLLAENAALKKQRATGAATTVPVQGCSSAQPTPAALPPANATLNMPPPKNDLTTSHGGGRLNLPPPRNATVLNLPLPRAMNLPPPKNDIVSDVGGSNIPLPCNDDTVSNLPLPSHGNIHKRKEPSATSPPAPRPSVTTAIDTDPLSWDDIGVIDRYAFFLPTRFG